MSNELRLRSDVLEWRDVDGEVVALELRASTYLAVNRTGAAIWPSLVKGTTREALLAILANRYRIDAPTAARDLDAFLEMLRQRDLLEGVCE